MASKKWTSLLVASTLVTISPSASADTLTFGVVPQQSAQTLAKKWTPIFRYLARKTGHEIKFATAKSIPAFEQRLATGEYDLAYMNPYHYTVFHRNPGYKAFARQMNKRIKGIVVVPKDSPITSIEQLSGNALAFPAPAAFAASVLPRAHFKNTGIDVQPRYVRSHDSVYLTVSRGLFKAGGGVMRTFKNTDPKVRENLRILWTTDTFTPHAFAANPNVSESTVNDIANAMVAMNDDPEGQALLKTISFKGMQRAVDSDWDDVRGLGLKLLDELIHN
jgi:phosphonate transport system substrate-binding protein